MDVSDFHGESSRCHASANASGLGIGQRNRKHLELSSPQTTSSHAARRSALASTCASSACCLGRRRQSAQGRQVELVEDGGSTTCPPSATGRRGCRGSASIRLSNSPLMSRKRLGPACRRRPTRTSWWSTAVSGRPNICKNFSASVRPGARAAGTPARRGSCPALQPPRVGRVESRTGTSSTRADRVQWRLRPGADGSTYASS